MFWMRMAVMLASGFCFRPMVCPEKIISRGDPYTWQIEQTVAAVVETLAIADLDWIICYQSRVGPLKWVGPSTPDELSRAAEDGIGVVVVPIAFVSEHSETLVELDIEYRALAETLAVPFYRRVPALAINETFIAGLARVIGEALVKPIGIYPGGDGPGKKRKNTPGNNNFKRKGAAWCPFLPLQFMATVHPTRR